MSTQFSLLKTRRFGPFFWTQFFGAFNDNLFKNALLVLLTYQTIRWTTLKPELLANLAAGIFIFPFFIFSATAGQLADKYDKAKLSRLVKVLEIVIILIVALGFWLESLNVLLFCLFLFGLHSTLFGPVKYSILPQHIKENELVGANALIEAGTFVAILIGTLAGGLLAGVKNGEIWISLACLIVALCGFLSSLKVPDAPPPAPELLINPNPLTETWRNIGFARENRAVFLAILGISWFWLFGALLLAQFPAYAKNVLGGSEVTVTLLLGIFTVGIAFGSLLCEKLCAGHIEIGLVPFGSIGLSIFCLDLALASPAVAPTAPLLFLELLAAPGTLRVLFDLFAIGLFGGFFIVPLYAMVQVRSNVAHRARIIAANNIMNALFMVGGAGTAAALLAAGLSIPALFAVAALCNAAVAFYIYRLVPEFLLRFMLWLLVHTIYRVEKNGGSHLPEEGGALMVCNHVSHVDMLLIMSACRRPIRFVVDQKWFKKPFFAFFLKDSKAIGVDMSLESPLAQEEIVQKITTALTAGELVCLFPEGKITQDGELAAFRLNLEVLLDVVKVPVIPLSLSGLWNSALSTRYQGWQRLLKLKFLRKIVFSVGEPAVNVTSEKLFQSVLFLRGNIQ